VKQVPGQGHNLWHQKTYWATLNAGHPIHSAVDILRWWQLVVMMVFSGGDLVVASFVQLG